MKAHGSGRRAGARTAVVAGVVVAAVALLVGVGTAATPLLSALPAVGGTGSLLDRVDGASAPPAAQPTAQPAAPKDDADDDEDDVDKPPCPPTFRACVDLTRQRAWLVDKGKVVRGPMDIVTGDVSDPTPKGNFTVQFKAAQYMSREYHVAMPWSVFFAPGGIAFHEGDPSSPSAGCVKLSGNNAHAFFQFLNVGDPVQVV